ncbi:hypothetical protein V8G54_034667 [Vigna mungo]|uniref:Retrotransposon gag domain-containing protein n=1 Tax=Vigna mungo TaxID=3915 RepID=A0AAQ3MEB2_VIGMU
MQTCKPLVENSTKFIIYVALLDRSKASILCDDWDHVPENVKNQIWQSILDYVSENLKEREGKIRTHTDNSIPHGLILTFYTVRSFVTALSAKNKVEFVLGSAIQPAKTDVTFPAWFRCNSIVVSWLLHFVSPSIRESIIWMDNAIDIWNDLKNRFAQGDLARISTLQMEATTLSQGELSVTEFFTKLGVIWDEFDSFRPDLVCILKPRRRKDPMEATPAEIFVGQGSTVAMVRVGVDASRAEGFGKDEPPLGRERGHRGHAMLAVAPATTITVDNNLTE